MFSLLLKWYVRINLGAFSAPLASLALSVVHALHVLSPNSTCRITSSITTNACPSCRCGCLTSSSCSREKAVDEEDDSMDNGYGLAT